MRRSGTVAIVGVVLVSAAAAGLLVHYADRTPPRHIPPYDAAYSRTATWDAPPIGHQFTAAQIAALAARGTLAVMNPAVPGFDIGQHFAATRSLVRAAAGA